MENQELIQSLKAAGIDLSPEQLKQLNGFAPVITKEMALESVKKKNLNVEVKDNQVRSTVISKLAGASSKNKDSYRPTTEQLEKINEMSLRTLDANEVYVFELSSADMEVDRSYEHFSNKAINDMVAMAPGTPVFLDHDWSVKSVVGKVFDAKNKKGVLTEWAYFPKNATTETILENMFNGIINKLSVGFSVDFDQMTCDSCSKSIFDYECEHYPGQKDKKGNEVTVSINRVKELYERSLVGVPCQRGTNIKGIESLSPYENEIFEKGGIVAKAYSDPLVEIDSNTFLRADGETLSVSDAGVLELEAPESLEIISEDTIKTGKDTIQDNIVGMENDKVKEAEAMEPEVQEEEAPQEVEEVSKEVPADEPVAKEEPKASEIKIELPEEFTKLLNALVESVKTLGEDQKAIHKKLDVAMTLSTAGLKSMLEAEAPEADESLSKSRQYAISKGWIPSTEDLGGQE